MEMFEGATTSEDVPVIRKNFQQIIGSINVYMYTICNQLMNPSSRCKEITKYQQLNIMQPKNCSLKIECLL